MRAFALTMWMSACTINAVVGDSLEPTPPPVPTDLPCEDDPALPMPDEVCDGVDNDCDGLTDEGDVCLVSQRFSQIATMDLLFVIDNSVTMLPHQLTIADGVEAMIPWVVGPGADVHVGVITTDMEDPSQRGRLQPVGDRRWGSATDQPEVLAAWLRDAVLVGDEGSGEERPLDALVHAIGPDPRPINQGFRRPGAHLTVIVISDEDDASDVSLDGALGALHADGGVTVHAIVSEDASCPEQPAARTIGLVASSGGAVLSICEPSYGPFLSAIGQLAAVDGLQRRFTLDLPAQPGTVQVQLTLPGGVTRALTPDAYGLGADGRTLLLASPPPRSSTVDVHYQRVPEPADR